MTAMYYIAVHAEACQATDALIGEKGLSALPVFTRAFTMLQDIERDGGHDTAEQRLDMLAEIERAYHANSSVTSQLAALCARDPSPEVRSLSSKFAELEDSTADR